MLPNRAHVHFRIFNLGEKLVLACRETARVTSTTGSVAFDETGRHRSSVKRVAGSLFEGVMRMTREEMEEAPRVVRTVLSTRAGVVVVPYHIDRGHTVTAREARSFVAFAQARPMLRVSTPLIGPRPRAALRRGSRA